MTIDTAHIRLFSDNFDVILSGRGETADDDPVPLHLSISCKPLDWQLSALAQVLDSFLSSLQTVESLEIGAYHNNLHDEFEVIQWRELLHPFSSVKDMTLTCKESVRLIAPALQELAGERATEVLPALKNIFFQTYDWRPSGPVKEAIGQFIATRQLSSHPVTVHYRD